MQRVRVLEHVVEEGPMILVNALGLARGPRGVNDVGQVAWSWPAARLQMREGIKRVEVQDRKLLREERADMSCQIARREHDGRTRLRGDQLVPRDGLIRVERHISPAGGEH